MSDPDIMNRIETAARASMNPRRFAHCRSTGMLARELCSRFGQNGDKGFIAGVFHDAARDASAAELIALAGRDGLPITEEDRKHPLVMHGRAAAVMLAELTGYGDLDVLWAIRDHVTGRPGMGFLSRIVLVSDYLEPTRDFLEETARKRILALDLDAMVREVMSGKIAYVKSIHEPVAEASLALKGELDG